MLDLKQISAFFPEPLRAHKKNILREYLQFKILEAIAESPYVERLAFMGGTAIHVLHGSSRFSEDLDFDNRGLNAKEFQNLVSRIVLRLKRLGRPVETRLIMGTAYRAYLRFPSVLYENRISRHRQEKLTIRMDTEPQDFVYTPEKIILNRFDVFTRIAAAPPALLLAQKILCVFDRPRVMGRDFYDIIYLMGRTKADFAYLESKLGIKDASDLKERLLKRCQAFDFLKLSSELEPFVYDPQDASKINLFPEYLKNVDFGVGPG